MTAQGLCGFLRVIQIALHDGRAGQKDLAFGSVGNFFFGIWFDDLDEGIRERQSDAAFFVTISRSQAAGGDGLGGSVTFTYLDHAVVIHQEFVKFLFQFDGE